MEDTLINGFDEIMTHIKNQEERIRQLEEELRTLNSEWARKRDTDGDSYRIIINDLKEENRLLKEGVK
tara:strand:- start:228 stop:431 length:204 start_codon:yes stop_codon:yes gene_type:complete